MAWRDGGRSVGAEDVEVEVEGGHQRHTGSAAFGRHGNGSAAAVAAAVAAPALSGIPHSPPSPSPRSAMEPEVTRLLRSARFVPLTALKHAAEEHSVRATEGERVMEAVVIFADVSGKAAGTTTQWIFWHLCEA